MSTKPVCVSTIKKGSTVVIDGRACKVTDIQVSRPGKHGHAKVRMTGVGLIDEKKRIIIMPGHDHIDSPIINKRTAQVLSISGDMANVMDMETYETFDLKIPTDLKEKCTDGVTAAYWIIMDNKVMKDIN